MIRITLRSIDGTSPSEERIQRPERPQRANRPLGNISPLQSFIIRTHSGQSANGREELPRPNAPVQDENYNNRSISPLFANQSSSLPTYSSYHIHRIAPSSHFSSNSQPCESHPTRPQFIDVEYSSEQPNSSLNSQEFRIHTTPEFSPSGIHQQPVREGHHDHNRNRSWTENNPSGNINTERAEGQPEPSISRDMPGTSRRAERQVTTHRLNRPGTYRDEVQETSPASSRSNHSLLNHQWERERRSRNSRGISTLRSYSPALETNSGAQVRRQNWEIWSGVGGLSQRRLARREHRLEPNTNVETMNIPPLINLVEGEDDHEAGSPNNIQDTEQEIRYINVNMNQQSQLQFANIQESERRSSWEEDIVTSDDNVNVIEDDEDGLIPQEEEDEDNEVLLSVPAEDSGDNDSSHESAADSVCHMDTEARTRNEDVRQLVLSALECPVCFDYVIPPIVQCYEGHLVCNKCRMRLDHCPECRGPFSSVRPRAIEKIANYLEYPCSYEGCMQYVTSADRNVHAKACVFRNYVCPIAPTICPWSGQKEALRNHIITTHYRHVHWIINSKLTFTIEPRLGEERVFIIEAIENLFHVKFVITPHNKLKGSVTLLGYDALRTENMNVVVLVQSSERASPFLMISRSPAGESDEMDMRLEKFAVFNISQLTQSNILPSLITVRVAIGKRDILRQLDRLFE